MYPTIKCLVQRSPPQPSQKMIWGGADNEGVSDNSCLSKIIFLKVDLNCSPFVQSFSPNYFYILLSNRNMFLKTAFRIWKKLRFL